MHFSSRNSPTSLISKKKIFYTKTFTLIKYKLNYTLSNNRAEVLGGGHSISCFKQRSSSNLFDSLEANSVALGSFTDKASSKAGNIYILLNGGVKSISTGSVPASTPSGWYFIL